MTKDELRAEVSRLIKCATLQDSKDLMKIYSEFFFATIINHQKDIVNSEADREAKLINQMMLTKVLHLQGVTEGVSYKSNKGINLNNIIDPTIVASLIRNVYETVGMFNLIYINTKSNDEKTILYNLWVHSGLKFRHRFESIITKKENFEKLEQEKLQLKQIEFDIENTALYLALTPDNQDKIQSKLKEKDYKIKFENNEVKFLHWQQLSDVMGIKPKMFDNAYTYFSLYSHPSNVAVFQFRDMFHKDEDFLRATNFNLKYLFALSSIFIADYIKMFPNVLETFNSLDIRDQIIINFNNTFFRGEKYSINDSWLAVE